MPTVVIPICFLERSDITPNEAECWVKGRTVSAIVAELLARFPSLCTRFKDKDGWPSTNWFGLYREGNGGEYDLRGTPELVLDEKDRLYVVNHIGC